MKRLVCIIFVFSLIGCAEEAGTLRGQGDDVKTPLDVPLDNGDDNSNLETPPAAPEPPSKPQFIDMAWDGQSKADEWNEIAFVAIADVGETLLAEGSRDVQEFCPEFNNLNADGRSMFWISLLAAMVKHESQFNSGASRRISTPLGEIVKRGLLMLDLNRTQTHNCGVAESQELNNPQANLTCGIRILEYWVKTDGVIARRAQGQSRGPARYWSSLQSSGSLQDIKNITASSEICR